MSLAASNHDVVNICELTDWTWCWQDDGKFFSTDGLPKTPFPHGWKADESLYIAGLGRKGLLGASFDAKHIAEDIAASYLKEKIIA
jgi:hypothetical protein